MIRRRRAIQSCLVPALGLALGHSNANEPWPSRTVRMTVPHAPGGGTDVLARVLAERLQAALGQPFIVENRPGAGINIGTTHVAKQPGDGYNLLVTTNTHVMNAAFFKQLPYDPVKDFAPVSLLATSPLLMVVNAQSQAKTARDFVSLARTAPGTRSYGSTGVGTPQHLAPAMLEAATGMKLLHVPYKGAALVANALLAGEVDMAIGAVSALVPHVRSGRLRALGLASASPSTLLPGVPTLSEALGLPGWSVDLWYAVLAPAGTPRPVLDRLSTEIARIMRDPKLQSERFAPLGIEGAGSPSQQLAELMAAEMPKYRRAAIDANIQPE